MSHDQEYLQRHLQDIQRVHGLAHNHEIRAGYQTWLSLIQEKYQQQPSALLALCVDYIESLEAVLPISEYKIHYVPRAQAIANFYRDHPEQRQQLIALLNELYDLGKPYFVRQHTYHEYLVKGLLNLKEILEKTQELWDLQQLYHQGDFHFPAGLLDLLDAYIDLLGPYQALNYDEREPLIKGLQLQIVKTYPEEILNLFLFAIEKEAYFHYWVSKRLFFVLMEQKDKRLNQAEILEKLVQNFDLIIQKMIYAKPFILHLAFSIEKVAKAQQLNRVIVDAMVQIQFTKYSTHIIFPNFDIQTKPINHFSTSFR